MASRSFHRSTFHSPQPPSGIGGNSFSLLFSMMLLFNFRRVGVPFAIIFINQVKTIFSLNYFLFSTFLAKIYSKLIHWVYFGFIKNAQFLNNFLCNSLVINGAKKKIELRLAGIISVSTVWMQQSNCGSYANIISARRSFCIQLNYVVCDRAHRVIAINRTLIGVFAGGTKKKNNLHIHDICIRISINQTNVDIVSIICS